MLDNKRTDEDEKTKGALQPRNTRAWFSMKNPEPQFPRHSALAQCLASVFFLFLFLLSLSSFSAVRSSTACHPPSISRVRPVHISTRGKIGELPPKKCAPTHNSFLPLYLFRLFAFFLSSRFSVSCFFMRWSGLVAFASLNAPACLSEALFVCVIPGATDGLSPIRDGNFALANNTSQTDSREESGICAHRVLQGISGITNSMWSLRKETKVKV